MKLIRKPVKEDDESSTIGPFLFKLIPYWPVFLSLLVLAIGCAWTYMQFATPMYETNARLLFRDNKSDGPDTKSLQALDVISPKRTVDNEIQVIQSPDLMDKVVTDLDLYAPIYEEGRFKETLAYTTSPIVVSTNDIRTLKMTPKVYFSATNTMVIINNQKYPLGKLVRTPYGNLIFSKNPHFTQQSDAGSSFYFSLLPSRKVAEGITGNLKADIANKQSSIIDLVLKDENPERGEDILNDLIKFYNLSIDEEKNQLAANTARFIDDRLTTVENNMLDIEHQQQSYRSNRGAIDLSTQGKLYLENVSTNDQKVGEINMQLSVLNQIDRYVRSKDMSNGIVPSTAGVNDEGLTQMVKNIYELQQEYESLKKSTGENNPVVVSLNDKIEKIRPQILENLQNQKQSLQASKSDLSSTNQGYSSQLQSIPESEKKLVDINRELNLKSELYTYLLQKKEETALSFISNGSNSKIIEHPQSSERPVSPKRSIVYLAALMAAGLLGTAFATGREAMRRNVMYQTDIESLTQMPVISEITAGESRKPIVIGDNQRTLIAEQFRRLRTTLSYLGIGGSKKRVLVTSAISGEGKSFVAINLAMSLALTGKKVALLDFDLSRPSLHVKLKVKPDKGISDFLTGGADVSSIITRTAINDNLFFIPAGKVLGNSSELITNGKPEELLNYLDTIFDYIIVDIAPVGPVSDAYVISPLCDATLYIIRHAYTPKVLVKRIDRNNILNNLNNAAIIFNDVSGRNFAHYGYGYGYGYVYGDKGNKRLNDKNE